MTIPEKNLFLNERGFGTNESGKATIICGDNGKELDMTLFYHPDGRAGHEVCLIPRVRLKDRVPAFVPTKDNEFIFTISVNRKGAMGTVNIMKYSSEDLSAEEFVTAFQIDNSGRVVMVRSRGMVRNEEADQMLLGEFSNAFQAALNRSYASEIEKPFYGYSILTEKEPVYRKRAEPVHA